MKKLTYLTLTALIGSLLFFSGCKKKYGVTYTYKTMKPVYMSYDELRSSVKSQDAQDLKNPGKIYVKDDYIFVSEVKKGVHIINNSNPSNPTKEGFINIPGNRDIAINGDVLYSDSYVDFVTINISDVKNVKETGRLEHIYPYDETIDILNDQSFYDYDSTKGVVIDWKEEIITETFEDPNDRPETQEWIKEVNNQSISASNSNSKSGNSSIGGNNTNYWNPGVGGSLSRFATAKNHLYMLTNENLLVFNINNPTGPSEVNRINVGSGSETVFPSGNKLYIGSQTGMQIYDLSSPENPNYNSTYDHVTSCDPVIVDGNYAYVTLRSGNDCRWGNNLLDVVDVSDSYYPYEVASFNMTSPHGLGKDGKHLFVCNGDAGLKVFDASDPENFTGKEVASFANINAFDVIPVSSKDVLIMIGEDGLYQYDYSDVKNISQLSKINVVADDED